MDLMLVWGLLASARGRHTLSNSVRRLLRVGRRLARPLLSEHDRPHQLEGDRPGDGELGEVRRKESRRGERAANRGRVLHGHRRLAALDAPDPLVGDMRAFFRRFRS